VIEYKHLKPGMMFRANSCFLGYKNNGARSYVDLGDLLFVVDIRDNGIDPATTIDVLTKHGDLVYFWCNRWFLDRLDQV
jgi:hypothetical protein